MIIKLYSSSKPSFSLCLEELIDKIKKDFDNWDFLLFSIHPSFILEDINPLINKIFFTNNFVAFHAINSFIDENIFEKSVNVAVFKFEKRANIKKFYIEDIKEKDSLSKTAAYLNKNIDKFHIMIASLEEGEIGVFLEELSKKIDYYPIDNIIGGVSSGFRVSNEIRTFQFLDDKIIKDGFIILSFENVEANIDISLGFKPYGITYEISGADGNRIYLVDENRYFSNIAKNFLKGIKNPDIRYLWYLPLYILDENDGYVATLRTIKSIDEDCVEFFGPIKEKEHFKLSFATEEEILESDIKAAKRLSKKIKYPDIVFNFSCIARQYVLEDRQNEENRIYKDRLNSSIFGFFTYGEIGPDKTYKKLKLYNETSLIIGIKER